MEDGHPPRMAAIGRVDGGVGGGGGGRRSVGGAMSKVSSLCERFRACIVMDLIQAPYRGGSGVPGSPLLLWVIIVTTSLSVELRLV